jgi:hypothetical protein
MIAFISGHLDLTEQEFIEHYVPRIDDANHNGHHFVVGDARGCDTMAMKYIHSKGLAGRLTVYHMHTAPRNYVEGAWKRGGYGDDEERDATLTYQSNYDIAWVRLGREKSGTSKNIERRKEKNKQLADKWKKVLSGKFSSSAKCLIIEPQEGTINMIYDNSISEKNISKTM